jgi:hypothetical protein
MMAGSESGSVPLTNGPGRPKTLRIWTTVNFIYQFCYVGEGGTRPAGGGDDRRAPLPLGPVRGTPAQGSSQE